MRIFRHGQSLAIVIPDSLCNKLKLKENAELEFFEVEPGLLALASKEYLTQRVSQAIKPQFAQSTAANVVKVPDLLSFSTETQARNASKQWDVALKKGDLLAVFSSSDKRYYLVSLALYSNVSSKLSILLESQKTFAELTQESKLPAQQVAAVLSAMKEKGEVIEKRKGCYLLVK